MTTKLLLIIGGLLILGIAAFLLLYKSPVYSPSTSQVPTLQRTSDLSTVETNLNSEDLNALDSKLNQIDQDSSGF